MKKSEAEFLLAIFFGAFAGLFLYQGISHTGNWPNWLYIMAGSIEIICCLESLITGSIYKVKDIRG